MTFLPDTTLARRVEPSPNHGVRAGGPPDMLILHYTGMASGQAALRRLCEPEAQVSAHHLVFEDGEILQMVPEARRAWHAGRACWAGESDVNGRSIGIEIVHPGHAGGLPAYPDAQIEAVIALCADILARHAIPAPKVLAHSDVAPDRKEDPGETFPWDRLARAGIGLWVPPAPIREGEALRLGDAGEPVRALQDGLARYGYALPGDGRFGQTTHEVVTAFQRHFRQERVDGIADFSTLETLRSLLTTMPDLDPAHETRA